MSYTLNDLLERLPERYHSAIRASEEGYCVVDLRPISDMANPGRYRVNLERLIEDVTLSSEPLSKCFDMFVSMDGERLEDSGPVYFTEVSVELGPLPGAGARIEGYAAIEKAEELGFLLSKYEDPIEGARHGLSVDEARDIAREDASLIYLDLLPEAGLEASERFYDFQAFLAEQPGRLHEALEVAWDWFTACGGQPPLFDNSSEPDTAQGILQEMREAEWGLPGDPDDHEDVIQRMLEWLRSRSVCS